jgi:protein-arginine kinase activator protein McsA
MKCESFGSKHQGRHEAEFKITVVKDWRNTERLYLCEKCLSELQKSTTYKDFEIVVENLIRKNAGMKI